MTPSLTPSLMHRRPGFRALGYFWLMLLSAIAAGAGFLQYSYVPSLQARRAASAADGGVSGFDAVIAPARSAEAAPAPWARGGRETPLAQLVAAVTPAATDARDPVENPSFGSGASTPVQDFAPGAMMSKSASLAESATFRN